MIRVNGDIQPHQFDKLLIITVTKESSEVGRVILVLINGRDFAITKDVLEDPSGDTGEFGNEVHGVFECSLPVLSFVDTVRVSLGKRRVVVELKAINQHDMAMRTQGEKTYRCDGQGELRHGVQCVGASVNQLLDEFGKFGSSCPFLGQ